MDKIDRIEDKIEKLLALSQSSNPNEAKAALLKAQDLMLKYNLSFDYRKQNSEICTETIDINHKDYHIKMAGIISENFRTRTWYGNDQICFMGYRDDVMASRYCLEYLFKESSDCFSQYIHDHDDKFSSEPLFYLKYIHKQWMNGFVTGIEDAFNERKNDPKYELMLVTPAEVLIEYEKMNLRSAPLEDRKIRNQEAYDSGYINGREALDKRSIEENA